MNPKDAPWLAPAAVLVAALAAAAFGALNSPATVTGLLEEGGGVETASALLHFAAAAVALAFWRRAHGLFGLIAICALLMGARELGWHKAFTSHGVFSSKQYFYDTVPMSEKLLAGAVVLTVLILLAVSLTASVRDIRRLVADRAPAVTGLITLAVVVPLLMLVDALPRFERNAGLSPSDDHLAVLLALEELGELALPVIVMLVILQIARAFAGPAGPAGRAVQRGDSAPSTA